MSPTTAAFLAAAGFLGGLVDSVVGGGGVITLPAFLVAGLPVQSALGTNKLAGTSASTTATLVFAGAGRVDRKLQLRAAPVALLFAAAGAVTATRTDPSALRLLVIVAVLVSAAWAVLRPGLPERPPQPSRRASLLALGGIAAVGFYDGLLGPGTGLFFFAILTGPLQLGFIDGAGNGRALNLASNVGALLLFALLGHVNVLYGLVMAAGVVLGARLGARLTLARGAAFVRPMLVVACLLLVGRLVLGTHV
jgi:uncharacterized membrane protein YfcA